MQDKPKTKHECVAGDFRVPERLPKYVHRRKRDGVLLFRKRFGTGIIEQRLMAQFPVGESATPEALAEVDRLANGSIDDKLAYRVPRAKVFAEFLSPDGRCLFAAMERSAKARAKKYDFSYDLPKGWCRERFLMQEGLCEISGIPFRQDMTKRSPFMPSLDRISPLAGYTPGNCRLVSYIVNCALGQFGEGALLEMAAGVIDRSSASLEPR